jgi:hypothetical protein
MIEKFVVAPQIVVYKNAFKHSSELIDIMASDSDSIFNNWEQWYQQGYRKKTAFDRNTWVPKNDSDKAKKEFDYLNQICKAIDFIQQDYFDQFGNEKGVWPPYIKDWDKVSSPIDFIYVDYFRYDESIVGTGDNLDVLLMDYHVDEFPIGYDANLSRDVITINLYLNDEYSGGEICAYDHISNKSYKYKPSPGDIVVMPSTEPFYHAVKGFSGADRYFLRVFVKYDSIGSPEWQKKYNDNMDLALQEVEDQKQDYIKNHMQTIKVFDKEIDVKEMM